MAMTTLPTRPRRNVGEGAIGYLMRLAEAHGVPLLSEMTAQLGIPWFEAAQGKHVRTVAASVGIDAAELAFDTAIVSSRSVLLRGERLRRRQWSVHAGRSACPQCLTEDASGTAFDPLPRSWHRAWWDVRALTVCPRHGAVLLTCCRYCGAPFDFRSTSVAKCPNGHAIRSQRPRHVKNFAGDAYVVGRLGGAPRIRNEFLDGGHLADAIEAIELVGRTSLSVHGHRNRLLEPHDVLDGGYSVFADWPGAFNDVLDGLFASSRTGLGHWGAAATYGPLHARLQKMPRGTIAVGMIELVRKHSLSNGVSISKPVFGISDRPTDVCAISHAAARLGMGFSRARKVLKLRGFVPSKTRRGTPVRIPSLALEEILSQRQTVLGPRALSVRLSIGRTQARRLVTAGFFGKPRRSVRVADVDAFLERLSRNVPRSFGRAGIAPLPHACRTARCALGPAVDAILDGRLRPAGFRASRGLSGVYVRYSDLRAIGKASRDAVTIEDAAKELHVKWQALRDLIRVGLLRTDGRRVTPGAIKRFKREFVAGARLAQSAGMRPRTLMNILDEAGLAPVAAPPRCRQVFYRRSDIIHARGLKSGFPSLHSTAAAGG